MKQFAGVFTRFPWRKFFLAYRYCALLNVGCALFITYVLAWEPRFWINLLASMCIGSIAFCIIYATRLLFFSTRRPDWKISAALSLFSAAIALPAGITLFGWIMHVEVNALDAYTSPKMARTWLLTLATAGIGILLLLNREKVARLEALAAQQQAHAESVARQALQAQLQLLQAQIEPHMLFNTLANLQGLIGFDTERAQLLLDQLIQYLRATLISSRAASTTLGQEFALMEAYLGLMSVRMGQRLSYTIALPDDLRALVLPPMLLQPLVENAIQHGLEAKIDGGHIDVSACREGRNLVLTVSDSGLGLDHPQQSRQGGHVGLSNIRERLQAIHGERAAFSLSAAQPCGAVARLTLPLSAP